MLDLGFPIADTSSGCGSQSAWGVELARGTEQSRERFGLLD